MMRMDSSFSVKISPSVFPNTWTFFKNNIDVISIFLKNLLNSDVSKKAKISVKIHMDKFVEFDLKSNELKSVYSKIFLGTYKLSYDKIYDRVVLTVTDFTERNYEHISKLLNFLVKRNRVVGNKINEELTFDNYTSTIVEITVNLTMVTSMETMSIMNEFENIYKETYQQCKEYFNVVTK